MEPVVMTDSAHKRFKLAPALAFMEQNLFRPRPAKYTKPVEEIHLAAVKNPQEELILVARQINALIRQGYRYREIAVVTGAVEAYQSYMDPVFTKYEIPYFMDTTKEVLFHPFIECIRAALEIVDTNFSYEAVMRFCGVDSVILRRTIWTGWTVIWLQPVSAAKRRGADDGGICHGRKRFTIWNSSKNSGKKYMGILSRLQQYLPEKMPVFRMASGHCISC